ncbi:MAG: hypothetical protein NWT08_04820 [Akkermansiaceae bacterium]|jgi:hypothetical protein|nr:hypothetical protein [Akkermansiaceae bacterium]MDP4646477.1 hypothetical protein [Akkermansiaceae bacterium]MDP4780085.1 hypothetical protein [Akkermansiaceae bacterium]MDP4847678.1 hypothetical protein [Akkermansiaceae bacterium]MDP4896371.1 hypothetical protein [Akkermansiaceae bacterium]
MKYLIIVALAAFAFLTSITPASAQNDDGDSGRSSKRTMKVIGFGGELDSVFYESKGKKIELYASTGSLSSPLLLPSGGVLKLYHETQIPVKGSPDQTVPQYRECGSVEFPSGSKMIVLLVVPPDLKEANIRGRAFKDSYTSHPTLTARVFNMSPKQIGVRAGDSSVSLQPGEEGMMAWRPKPYNSVAFEVAVRNKENTGWNVISSGEELTAVGLRTFIFFVATGAEDEGGPVSSVMIQDKVGSDSEDME